MRRGISKHMEAKTHLTDVEEVVTAVILFLRIFAFFFGFGFLLSDFANIGAIGGGNILSALSPGPLGMLEIPSGLILVLAGIEPQIIAVAIQWVIRS